MRREYQLKPNYLSLVLLEGMKGMVVEVKLFATFREGRFDQREIELPEGSSLGDLLEHLNIPEEEARIMIVNGTACSAERKLALHDVVSIFPAIAGG